MSKRKSSVKGEEPVELDIPEGVDDAYQAIEVLRTWIADGTLRVAINATAFGDQAGEWGRLLGELAVHIARANAYEGHMPEDQALHTIRLAFESAVHSGRPPVEGGVPGRIRH